MKATTSHCVYTQVSRFPHKSLHLTMVQNEDRLWGVVDSGTGKEITPCKYQTMEKSYGNYSNYTIVSNDGKYGTIDGCGKEIIKLQYDGIEAFENERLVVRQGEEYALIDSSGKIIVEFGKYDTLKVKDNIVNTKKNGKYGVLDLNGNELLPCIYDYITAGLDFVSPIHFITATVNGLAGLFDIKGRQITPIEYERINSSKGYIIAQKNGLNAMFDKDMNPVLPFEYSKIVPDPEKKIIDVKKGDKNGIVDFKGNVIIPTIYEMVWWKEDAVYVETYGYPYNLKGLLDHKGNTLLPCVYHEIGHLGGTLYIAQRYKESKSEVWDIATGKVTNHDFTIDFAYNDKCAIVKAGKKYGALKGKDIPVVPLEYDKLEYIYSGKVLMATVDKKKGVVDFSNKVIVPIKYDKIGDGNFSEGYVFICNKKKWGVLNINTGEEIIPPTYSDIMGTGVGFAVEYDQKWGFVDMLGNPLGKSAETANNDIKPQKEKKEKKAKAPKPVCNFDRVKGFSEGLAAAEYNGKWGWINTEGNIIFPFICSDVYPWEKNGYALARSNGDRFYINKKGERVDTEEYSSSIQNEPILKQLYNDRKYGYRDNDGNVVLSPIYDRVEDSWLPEDTEHFVVKNGQYWGVVNRKAEIVLPFEYNDIYRDESGLYILSKDNKWALADGCLNVLTPHIYDKMEIHNNGLITVKINGLYGSINIKGEEVSPAIYSNAEIYPNGYMVACKDNHYGIIAPDGTISCPFKFERIGAIDCETGLTVATQNYKDGFINLKGEVIIPFKYRSAWPFLHGYAKVKDDQLNAVIDPAGEFAAPMEYEHIFLDRESDYINKELGLVAFQKGKKICIYDLINKKEVIPPTYSDIRPCSDGMIPVCYKKQWGFIDINGNPLVVNGLE